MSTEPISGAPYIIICSGETNVALATTSADRVRAVTIAAAQLTSYMQSYYKHFKVSDLQPISTLQHELMDWSKGEIELTPEQVDQKVEALLTEFHELEDKYY